MQTVSFEKNGVCVNGHRIDNVKNFKLETDEHNVSKITMTFYGEVEGLDNQKPESAYHFKDSIKSPLSKEEVDEFFYQIKKAFHSKSKGGE